MSRRWIYICFRCGNPVRPEKEGRQRTFICPYCSYKNYFNNTEKILDNRRK